MTATNPNIENLLRHQDWVRALARSLVADPSRAEDVAQQTMLEAITNAPRDLRRPKGWLAQVARNAARAFARSDRRRQSREHEVAKSDVVLADPADAAHRAAAHKSLVDAVFELPEPYHTVVLLRYFEDLEPQQIAKQLERSVSTVRTQLQRGLTMMRDKLDRQFGDRGAWHAAVLPLFAPKQAAAGVSILTAIGSLAMWKVMMPVVAVLAALFVGLETIWAESTAIPDQGESGVPVVATVSDATDMQPVPVGRDQLSTKPVTPPAPEVATNRFHARVVSLDGTPLAGWKIGYGSSRTPRLIGKTMFIGRRLMQIDEPPIRDAMKSRQSLEAFARRFRGQEDAVVALLLGEKIAFPHVVCDAQGDFALADPESKKYLRVERDGYMIYGSGRLPADGSLVYVVGPSVEISGHTVDEHGNPLPGVNVLVSFSLSSLPGFGQELDGGIQQNRGTDSAADGSFRLGEMPRQSVLRVGASKRGYTYVSRLTSDIHGPVRWEMRSKPKRKQEVLTGIVRLADGLPVFKARVVFGQTAGITDELGQFSMPNQGYSANTPLIAYLRGHQAAIRPRFGEQLQANPELAHDLALQLGPETLSISGRVLDADGKPLKNVVMILVDGVRDGSSIQWIESSLAGQQPKGERTDRSGAFTLNGLSDRTYNVHAVDEKNRMVLESGPIQAGTKDVVLRASADEHRRLEGVVVDSHNNPIPDVSISLTTVWMKTETITAYHNLQGEVKTDANGRFVVDSCPRKFVELSLIGARVKSKTMAVPDGEQLMRVTLLREIKFRLRVTSNLGADHFAVLDSAGNRLVTLWHKAGMETHDYVHPVFAKNAPLYEVSDLGTELLLLKGKKEVGRVPLNLRINQLNVIDV